jgi:hypothetical protein
MAYSNFLNLSLILTWSTLLMQGAGMALQATSQNQQPAQQIQPAIPGQPALPPVTVDQLPENPSPVTTSPTGQQAARPENDQAQTTPTASGTAAAQTEKPSGNAASRPAGAAIAPPKQRQVRSFLVKFGLIAGAGVALGTVYALSESSPSRVPGSAGH